MKIYIAASFPRRQEMYDVRKTLIEAGYTVTSRWLCPEHQNHTDYGNKPEFAAMDLQDVTDADVVVCFTDGEKQLTRGGRHTEIGIALGQGKRVFLVGPKEQVFHEHPLVHCLILPGEVAPLGVIISRLIAWITP